MSNNETRRVIIGSQNTDFAAKLKKFIENNGYKVTEIVVLAEHLIETIETSYNNDEPIYGLIITTDLAYKLNDKRLEFLSDCLYTIRSQHSDIKMAILSNEGEGHPLLAELVGIGIYNIFVRSETDNSIDVREILQSFEVQKEFAEVAKYRDYRKDILWRKIDRGANEVTIKTDKPQSLTKQEKDTVTVDSEKETTHTDDKPSGKNPEKTPSPGRSLIIDDDIEEYRIPFPTVKEKIVIRDRIFGTAVIAVIGSKSGTGTTHTSVSLSNYLARKGNKVALIECNDSGDFKYIELAYEGVKDENRSLGTKSFEIDGVNYFKSDFADLDLISLLAAEYTFIVLDLGYYKETAYFEEFLRSDIQIIVSSGSEWQQRHLKRFLDSTREYDQQPKWNIILPLVDSQTRSDIEGDLNLDKVYSLPYHPDPFRPNEETDSVFENILRVAPGTSGQVSKNSFAKISVIALIGLVLVLSALLLIK